MNKFITTILFFIIIGNAFATNNSLIDENFSKLEKKQIIELMQIMDSLIFAETNVKNIDSAYIMFLVKITNQQYDYSDSNHISSVNIASRFSDSIVFDRIWIKEYGIDPKTKQNVKEWLAFNVNGKYLKFLEQLSRRETHIYGYYKSVSEMNCILPSTKVWFFNNFDTLDFSDPDIRFMTIVHFITILYEKEL